MRSTKELARAVINRWLVAFPEIQAVALASIVAWVASERFFSHAHSVFATVIAIVCLAPGVVDHRRQAWTVVLGVATGIVVGEVVRRCGGEVLLQLAVGLFISMMAVSSVGLGPVVPIQAGVSTLLVLSLGADTAGFVRMIDVLIPASTRWLRRLAPHSAWPFPPPSLPRSAEAARASTGLPA